MIVVRQQDHSPEAEPSGRRRESLAMALRDTDMQVLWLATLTYHLGLGMQQVLLGWVVLALTNSEGMVGVVFAVRSAPNLVVGFAAGALTDRYDRRSPHATRGVRHGRGRVGCGLAGVHRAAHGVAFLAVHRSFGHGAGI